MFPGTVFDNLRDAVRIAGVNEATVTPAMEEALRIAELDASLGGSCSFLRSTASWW